MPQRASTAKRKSTRKTESTRTPRTTVETESWQTLDALPKRRRHPIDEAILHRPEGLESVLEIYEHFDLKGEHITLASFRRYTDLLAWQTRLGHIGKLVHQLVGVVPNDEEDRWFRTAHLMLTASLIEGLDRADVEFKVADVIRLYKIFEDRRVLGGSGKSKAGESLNDVPDRDGKLPRKFADTIKDIYGVTLAPKRAAAATAAPEKTDAKVHPAEPT